jgi:hypothetical protein
VSCAASKADESVDKSQRATKMENRTLLLIDAAINLTLGVLLGVFPGTVVTLLGIPPMVKPFYASILGAILFGIGLALLLERSRERMRLGGLDLGGAAAINLCGGIALALWLLFGDLDVPVRGRIIMWCLAGILFAISIIELAAWRRK